MENIIVGFVYDKNNDTVTSSNIDILYDLLPMLEKAPCETLERGVKISIKKQQIEKEMAKLYNKTN